MHSVVLGRLEDKGMILLQIEILGGSIEDKHKHFTTCLSYTNTLNSSMSPLSSLHMSLEFEYRLSFIITIKCE